MSRRRLPRNLTASFRWLARFPIKHRESLISFILCLSSSAPIVYFAVTKFDLEDPATGGDHGDVSQYVKMFSGTPLEEIRKPFRYRVITPWLARQVPFLPESVTQFFDIDSEKVIKFKFGMVNLLGLATTSFFLFRYCRCVSFSPLESILGSYLFLTSFFVVNFGGVPLVDALAYASLMLGIYSLVRGSYGLLFVAFTVGMFAKETTVLVIPAAILINDSWKSKIIPCLVCLPGLLAYAIFRLLILPTEFGANYSLPSAFAGILSILVPSERWLWIFIDGGSAFGILWLFCLHGFYLIRSDKSSPIYRLSFLVPFILLIPFLLATSIGRIWCLGFPFVIPLSLVSLRAVFTSMNESSNILERRQSIDS